ncbi:ImmA/IrrE family metallo-endopeptidase [Nostocoides vanveenii]|jgi:Zn-dependent peptidase ImmA (M78 family)|uniref:IrrE N-terminal-like domain-containing protein n=1 Tax=Nostocoides vanveenii TaxID=330835 RepID=A0ABN2L3Q4_9MICO
MNKQSTTDEPMRRSTLTTLRRLVPNRNLTFSEALRVAELQASRLRELLDVRGEALPEEAISELPRIRVVRRVLPTSGMSYWNGQEWVIALNFREPEARQRFTLLHEYKHILDHGSLERLYTGSRSADTAKQAEQAADYFAGCALMPKLLVKRAWGNRRQSPEALAQLFDVSPRAAEVRLAQLGLTEPMARCAPPARSQRSANRYFRLSTWPSPEWSAA